MRKILARAFVASRTLDALLLEGGTHIQGGPKLPAIDQARVAITGHSRNGKQSLIAAAFDERISAVVGSSPGAPVSAPVRFSSPDFNGETTKYVSDNRDWWLPSLHSYLGREHELPADGHMILALIAPRYVMLATARSDGEGDVSFADEQNVLANLPVWKLLSDSTDAIRIKWREGRHHGFDDPQTYVDWFDYSSGSSLAEHSHDELPHAWNWSTWRERTAATTPPPPPPSAALAERVRWMLGSGSETTTAQLVGGYAYCESGAIGNQWDYKAKLMMHDSFRGCRMPSPTLAGHDSSSSSGGGSCPHSVTRIALSFGAYVTASLFVPCATTACEELEGKPPLPVVIFLHGYSYQLGFTGIYGLYESETDGGLIPALVGQLGIAVLAWDLPGHGARQTEGPAAFYRRYQHASRLGAMVGEVESALHMIHCAAPQAFNTLPECSDGELFDGTYQKLRLPAFDEERVYLIGYSMGAAVALHAAALLPGVAGVASFGGWTPFENGRNASSASVVATGGNQMVYSTHALLPRLGLFSESLQAPLPYDYAELIAEIAPRPILLYAPTGNRFTLPGAVATAVSEASKAWQRSGSNKNFTFLTPDAPSDFTSAEISAALRWVRGVL
jgi:pimeloyl-ACP methyl ester carboxylesterase